MKTGPPRSPSRRSSPPPPTRMSHRSPGFRRGRSPERRRHSQSGVGRMSPPPRSRERREFRPSPRSQPPDFAVPRRSRSPIRESKRRSFSPKRKSPKRERERREQERERPARPSMSRKRSRSKSPPVAVGPPLHEGSARLGPYSGPPEGPPVRAYPGPEPYASAEPVLEIEHPGRSISSLGERFPEPSRGSYEEDQRDRPGFRVSDRPTRDLDKIPVDGHTDRPVFRGPDGSGYDMNELKKITIDIRRNIPVTKTRATERTIHPEDVVVVRRAAQEDNSYRLKDGEYASESTRRVTRDRYSNECRSPSPKSRRRLSPWEQEEANSLNHRRNKKQEKWWRNFFLVIVALLCELFFLGEGSRPIFNREEILEANKRSKYETEPNFEHRRVPMDEHQRVVAINDNPPHTQTSGGPRYESPGRYSSSHAPAPYYGGDREHGGSSRDYGRSRDYDRSHGPGSSFDPREKRRDDHFERREDLRHDLELRRRDDSRYPSHGEGMRYDKGRDYRDSDRGSDLRMRIHEKRSDRHDDHDMGHRHPMDRHDMDRERERDRRPMMQPSPPGDRRRGPMEYGHMGEERKMRGEIRMGPGSHGPGGRRNDTSDRFHPDPEFGPRPERFHGSKPWDVNPEYVPKGRAYFEHDNRDEMRMPNRGRGSMGMRGQFRGRWVMRGRPFRGQGPSRGFMGGRGPIRRGGYMPRYKQSSPHWEHDLFDNASPGHGNNGFNK